MALIAGFPDFAAKAALLAADLNAAFNAIVAQIGGVDADGVARAGNLDLENHAAAAGWRNGQKQEPRALVPLYFGGYLGVLEGSGEIPVDLYVREITACVAHTVNRVKTLKLTVKVNGIPSLVVEAPGPAEAVAQPFSWGVGGRIPAGAVVTVAAEFTMDNANGYYSAINVALWCSADHVE